MIEAQKWRQEGRKVTFTLCKVTPPPTAPPKRRYRIFNTPLNILVTTMAYPRCGFAKYLSCGEASNGLQCLLNFPDINFRVVTIVIGCLEVLVTSKMPWLKKTHTLTVKEKKIIKYQLRESRIINYSE